MDKYLYLFPYEKIPFGSRILIYGAGDVGQDYLQQMLMTNYCKVMAFLDKSHDKYPPMIVPIYAPERVLELQFDYIILAFKAEQRAQDVETFLLNLGIQQSKIVFQGTRKEVNNIVISDTSSIGHNNQENLAFQTAPLSIALKYGPGLGDAIIKKRLFIEIAKMAPEAKIDIYCPNGSKYISSIYSDQPALNQVIDDGGLLYVANQKKYTLAMSIFYMIVTDHINYEKLKEFNLDFAEKMQQHIENHKNYKLNTFPMSQVWIHFSRSFYRGWNCYSLYNYTNVFNIQDQKVNIPLMPSIEENFHKMNLKYYITLNFGNGATGKGNKQGISKQWPKEYFDEFVKLFKENYPNIEILQLGDTTADHIIGVDRYILGENLELIKYILKGAIFHLDIEGGLMHLATQLGTKCIVLFGSTQPYLFAYPQNINIISEKCGGCYCLHDNHYKCARNLEKPECMYSITPKMVFEKVEKYFESIKIYR